MLVGIVVWDLVVPVVLFGSQIVSFRYFIAFWTSVIIVLIVLKAIQFELSNLSLSENIGS